MSVQLGPRRDVVGVGVGATGIVFVERNSGDCNRLEEERRSHDGARERKEDANIPTSWVVQLLLVYWSIDFKSCIKSC
jgi:hypothetical protein